MEPCLPLPLDPEVLSDLVQKAKDWAVMHGAGMRSKECFSEDSINFAPFVLLPSTFPRREFKKAVKLQTVLNELMHKVAHDYDFLKDCLRNTVKVDDFTGRLFKIYETVRFEGVVQEVSLALLRSDYFVDLPHFMSKMVEINTVASSFGALSTILVEAHRYVLTELGHLDLLPNLPENKALEGLGGAMLTAWNMYNEPQAVILFVIEDTTYNICDQRFLEFEIKRQNPRVKVIRKSLSDISTQGRLGQGGRLFICQLEVAVIYFRSGYSPDQYHSEDDWAARLLLERSLAIKCPTIHYHLAGTKKVQQELSRPGILEKYLSLEQVESVKEIFTGLYSLDRDQAGDSAVKMVLENPENRFVMKPQREGGGNNIYGVKVKDYLEKIKDSEERSAWILMDKINPPIQKNYLIRPHHSEPIFTDVVCELGVFGAIIGSENSIILNSQVGHMLRTKASDSDEGGVAAGWGALDSCYLVDMEKIPSP